jgi:hypothetical protein
MSDLFTVEEHTLANDIKEKAMTLTTLALAHNDVALYKMLNDFIMIADPKMNRKVHKVAKQFESTVVEGINREAASKIADAIIKSPKSCLQVAQNLIKLKNQNNDIVKYFKKTIDVIKQKLGIFETLDQTKRHLRTLIESEAGDREKKLTAPNIDKDTGDILYHMDMATRHLDVLVSYELIMPHAGEITSISSSIQELAQRLRAELETKRTPLDSEERKQETEQEREKLPQAPTK